MRTPPVCRTWKRPWKTWTGYETLLGTYSNSPPLIIPVLMLIIKTSSTPSGNRKRDSTGSKTFFAPASELQPFGTATHHECPLVPPLGVSPIRLNLIGTLQTTRVGYMLRPLTLGFQNGQNKPSWNMEKKCLFF